MYEIPSYCGLKRPAGVKPMWWHSLLLFVKIHYIVVRLRKLKSGMLPKKKKKAYQWGQNWLTVWELTWRTAQLSLNIALGKMSFGAVWITVNTSALDCCYPFVTCHLIQEVCRFSVCLLTRLLSFREVCKGGVFLRLLPSQAEMSLEAH